MDQGRREPRKLYRSRRNRWIAGVAGGIAEYFNVSSALIRFLWILLLLPGGLPGVIPYLICWLVIPPEPDTRHEPG